MYKKILDITYSVPIRTLQKIQINFGDTFKDKDGLLWANGIKFYSDATQEPTKIELFQVKISN